MFDFMEKLKQNMVAHFISFYKRNDNRKRTG